MTAAALTPAERREWIGALVKAERARFDVQLRPLRGAVDWLKCLNRHPIPPERWGDLASRKTHWTVGARTMDALTLERHGKALETGKRHEYRAPGLRVVLRSADILDERHPYAIEVDFQGAMLSTAAHGIEVVDALLPHLHRDVYATVFGGDGDEYPWLPGRTDLCADIAVAGPGRDEFIEHGFFRSGNHSHTAAEFATRARLAGSSGQSTAWLNVDDTRGLGSAPGGRTFYLGQNPKLRIYERDKHHGGDWEQVRPRLEACGWDPSTERVLRIEHQLKRDWIVEQTDGKVLGRDVTLDEWLRSLPSVWSTLLRRTRHTVPVNSRPSNCPPSALWSTAHGALGDFRTARQDWSARAFRRNHLVPTYERIKDRAGAHLAMIAEILEMEPVDVIPAIIDRAEHLRAHSVAFRARAERIKRRLLAPVEKG